MFSRLRSLARHQFMSPEQRAFEAAQSLGLPVIERTPESLAASAVRHEAQLLLDRYDLAAFRDLYLDAFAAKKRLDCGTRIYAEIEDAIDEIFDDDIQTPQEMEHRLPDFRQAWLLSGNDPTTAAVYASLLSDIGFAWRGGDWAMNVTDEGWRNLGRYMALASDALEASEANAADNPFWHRVKVRLGISDGSSSSELYARFERALSFDPYDFDIHYDRAWQLLPRWHGSYEELEDFARQSAIRTRAKLGDQLYARIYTGLADQEYLPDTDADWGMLKAAFDDWAARHPLDYVWNAYAASAALFEDHHTLRQLFANHMRAFVPHAWPDPETAAQVLEDMA